MTLHFYDAPHQPATLFRVEMWVGSGKVAKVFRCAPNKLWWVPCCRQRRRARNVRVAVYNDELHASCKPGKGCERGRTR